VYCMFNSDGDVDSDNLMCYVMNDAWCMEDGV
jgi:hypothetical protein